MRLISGKPPSFQPALFGLLALTLSTLASPASPGTLILPSTPARALQSIPSYTQPPGADALAAWTEAAIVSFFPNRTSWETGFDNSMHPQLTATFGLPGAANYAQVYDFTGFRNLYSGLYTMLTGTLSTHVLHFADTVAYPFPDGDLGGYVYSTTVESGRHLNGTELTPAREAAFAVVEDIGRGRRRIREIRKMSNFLIH